jgi:2-oxoglutarate ferredoxin oxidoreductase subunit gamma
MLGALVGLTNMVKPESLLKVLEARLPVDFLAMNKQAFDLGLDLSKKHK